MFKEFAKLIGYGLGLKKPNSGTYNLTPTSHLGKMSQAESAKPVNVHMLWIGPKLSNLELLSINSFLKNGFRVCLWTYGTIFNIPKGVEECDANRIIDREFVRKCRNGSFAAFSDKFRYRVVSQYGGLWSDCDVVCLVSAIKFSERINSDFFVTEFVDRYGNIQVNNNLFYKVESSETPVLDIASHICDKIDIFDASWGAGGPRLLTKIIELTETNGYLLFPPSFANFVPSYEIPKSLFKNKRLPEECWFMHCFNEQWRRNGISYDREFPPNSLMDQLYRKVYG